MLKKYFLIFVFVFLSIFTSQVFDWDTSSLDVKVNSNVWIAFDLIKNTSRSSIIDNYRMVMSGNVYDNPKAYYGTLIKMAGPVTSTPNSLNWDGTKSCEVKIQVNSVPVDVILLCPASSIKKGDIITVYGYPCGILYSGYSEYLQIVGIKK